MPPTPPRNAPASRVESPRGALSPAAGAVGGALSVWRNRIAETQTLTRLSLSLLKAPGAVSAERREHLGRLFAVEARTLAQLPTADLPSLRGTTSARESGIHYRDRDAARAERYVTALRDGLCDALRDAAAQLHAADGDEAGAAGAQPAVADAGLRCEELLRTVDLVRAVLYPRVDDPTVTLAELFERAAAARAHAVLLSGETSARVQQVRGALRLLSEVLSAAGGHARVHAAREGAWLAITVRPAAARPAAAGDAAGEAPECAPLLSFAASLLHAECAHAEGTWHLRLIAQQG